MTKEAFGHLKYVIRWIHPQGGNLYTPLFPAVYGGRILERNPHKSFFLLAVHSHLYSFALRFLFLQAHATSYSF